MYELFRRIWSEDQGEDLVEYFLLVVVIGAVLVAALNSYDGAVSNVFSAATSAM